MTATVCLATPHDRAQAHHWLNIAPDNCVVRFSKPNRTLPQNARMWAMLTTVSQEARHNGRKYSPEQWKCLFMHACGWEVEFLTGLSGEPFPAGFKSSQMNKGQISEMMDFIEYWCAENGVSLTTRKEGE